MRNIHTQKTAGRDTHAAGSVNHDAIAEAGALACVLESAGNAQSLLRELEPEDFYDIRHKTIFEALVRLDKGKKDLNVTSLYSYLKEHGNLEDAGGLGYLSGLPGRTPSPAHFPDFKERIRNLASRRALSNDLAFVVELIGRPDMSTNQLHHSVAALGRTYAMKVSSEWEAFVEDGAEMVNRDMLHVEQIIEGILPEKAKLSVVSSAKSYKTWLTIHLALAISTGTEFLGHKTKRQKVLYIDLELKSQTFTQRLQAVSSRLNVKPEKQWLSHLALRGKLSGIRPRELINKIIKIGRDRGAEVVIIDPLFKLNTEGDENSSRDQTLLFNELDRLTTEGGFTLVLNDHSGKGYQFEKDPLDVMRGSSAKAGDLDAVMVLRRHLEENCFRVDLVHRELPHVPPFVIKWKFPTMELEPDLDPSKMRKSGTEQNKTAAILKALKSIVHTTPDKPISVTELAGRMGVSRQTLQTWLKEMEANGYINTIGSGNKARKTITAKGLAYVRGDNVPEPIQKLNPSYD